MISDWVVHSHKMCPKSKSRNQQDRLGQIKQNQNQKSKAFAHAHKNSVVCTNKTLAMISVMILVVG